jgi:hypothetical protein
LAWLEANKIGLFFQIKKPKSFNINGILSFVAGMLK